MGTNGEIDPTAAAPLGQLMEAAVFGREVEEFIERDRIGQYLIDKAKADLAEAHAALATADPYKPETIGNLQLKARVASCVRDWLAQAIQAGHDAQAQLKQERDEYGA